ncbi:MAG: hypothetical protein Q4G67_08395 [Actinomycetia bacterium]|nr:hypothetical protein [Actinomycetes bacterium]
MDGDSPTFAFSIITIVSATMLVVVLIIGFVLFRMLRPKVTIEEARRRAARALGSPADRSGDAPGAALEGCWNARVTDSPVKLNPFTSVGTLRVHDGSLAFHPEDAAQPLWRYPLRTIQAGRNPSPLLARIWIHHHELGTVHVQVSVEHINRMSRNDLKRGRERVYADAFLSQLRDSGAWIR